ncbi:MAG: hypothetical protein RL637_1442 [Pseudomonadota bacterium]|jgi:1-aminocyclopropane-1-carboxylate deaminase
MIELWNQLAATFQSSSLTLIDDPYLRQQGIELWLKRDDLLHPIVSGNKWRKLKYPLIDALNSDKKTIISMGGAYSNHLHALAFVGQALKLKTRAFIRGEKPLILNPTLRDLLDWQMELTFISRNDYRLLRANPEMFVEFNAKNYWLMEGGYSPLALIGVGEMIGEINNDYQVLCVACGTGTTLAGIINASDATKQIIGFSALKSAQFLYPQVEALLNNSKGQQWHIEFDYHHGGFAKMTPALIAFIGRFQQQHQIPLEPIYTAKMLYGIYDLIAQGYFSSGQRIIAIHSGGLQGYRQ